MDEQHTDYPHEPGFLYDCIACEAECYCDDLDGRGMECIHCAILEEESAGVADMIFGSDREDDQS